MQNDPLLRADDGQDDMDAIGDIWSDDASFVDALQDDFNLAAASGAEGRAE
jgi:hypothetical protein